MKNSDRFLYAFNKVEKHLRKMVAADRHLTFYRLVDEASKVNASVQVFRVDLNEFADLRNAIVHERTDEHVIAEPNDDTVSKIEWMAEQIAEPTRVPQVMSQGVFTLSAHQSIGEAVSQMFLHNYSQVPIYTGGQFTALLTTNTISRWLGASVEDDVFSLEETRIETVLGFTEEIDNYCFLPKNATAYDLLDKFRAYEVKGLRLETVLVTISGKPSDALLGMITIWDLPKVYELIKIPGVL